MRNRPPRFRHLLSVLWAGLLYLSAPSPQAGELRAVTESLPPLNYEENGALTGYSTELLQTVLQAAGLKAPISLLPWARAYQTALTQADVLIYSITRTPERENLFEWIGPISRRQIYLYKLRARKQVQVKTLTEAAAYRIGLVREMAASKEFLRTSGLPDSVFDYAPTSESNLKKLYLGRVDLIVSQDWGAAFLSKRTGHKPEELEALLLLDEAHSYYFALNKQSDPAIVARLRLGLEKVQLSGRMDKLKSKYLR